jgi:hypothetical protein
MRQIWMNGRPRVGAGFLSTVLLLVFAVLGVLVAGLLIAVSLVSAVVGSLVRAVFVPLGLGRRAPARASRFDPDPRPSAGAGPGEAPAPGGEAAAPTIHMEKDASGAWRPRD